jgi:hypothetical protein
MKSKLNLLYAGPKENGDDEGEEGAGSGDEG